MKDYQLFACMAVLSFLLVDFVTMGNGSIIIRIVRITIELLERIG